MSTTLVHIGILNDRSSKLNADDLYALNDLVENYSTDIVVSTPEILIPYLELNASGDVSENAQEEIPAQQSPESITRSLNEQSTRIDRAHQHLLVRNQPVAAPDPDVVSSTQSGSGKLDRSKQQAIEAAMLAAASNLSYIPAEPENSNSAMDTQADPHSEALDPREQAELLERKKAVIQETINQLVRQADSQAAALAQQTITENERHSELTEVFTEPQGEIKQKAASDLPTETEIISPGALEQKTTQQLRHNNLMIHEITESLARQLQSVGRDSAETSTDLATSSDTEASTDASDLARVKSSQAQEAQLEEPLIVPAVRESSKKAMSIARKKTIAILPPTEKQFIQLIDNLLERTVPGIPSMMMFTACESTARTGKVATAVAAGLADRNLGKILLIDGNLDEKDLTDSLTNLHTVGLSDVLNRQSSVAESILPTSLDNLFVLPAGIALLARQKTLNTRLASLSDELKDEFRFILIDGGNSRHTTTRTWGGFCESTYLVVTLGSTISEQATAAVAELQSSGARLLGCVVAT
jgi:Mrp family chromosome partitioning ATPase